MYYVSGDKNLLSKLYYMLEKEFCEKVELCKRDNKIYIEFDTEAGFKDEENFLSSEEIRQGVCGGGLIVGLDGKKFCITVKEVDDE